MEKFTNAVGWIMTVGVWGMVFSSIGLDLLNMGVNKWLSLVIALIGSVVACLIMVNTASRWLKDR